MSNTTILIAFIIIAVVIYIFYRNPPKIKPPENDGLSKGDIDAINNGITDINSDYYKEMPGGKRVRYETVVDLILSNLNAENKLAILDNPVNLDSALNMIAYAAGSSVEDPKFRSEQIERIKNEKRYVFPELGRDKCPPPPPAASVKQQQSESFNAAPYWTWHLNRIFNHLSGYKTEVEGILDDEIKINPTVENKFYTQFDKPEEVTDRLSKFTWKIKLTNINTKEVSSFEHVVIFQN